MLILRGVGIRGTGGAVVHAKHFWNENGDFIENENLFLKDHYVFGKKIEILDTN